MNGFTLRRGIVVPDLRQMLPLLSHGEAGRDLAAAVFEGRADRMRAMIARDRQLLATVAAGADAATSGDLLTFAVATGEPALVMALLECGMPPDGALPGRALALALMADSPDMAAVLLGAGASADPQTRPGGVDVLATAIDADHGAAVAILLRYGANPRWADEFGIDRVRLAVDAERFVIAEQLLAAGGCGWRVAEDGSTAAHRTALGAAFFDDADNRAAQQRLEARFADEARGNGIGWPLPSPSAIRARFHDRVWPTSAMAALGMIALPQTLARWAVSWP